MTHTPDEAQFVRSLEHDLAKLEVKHFIQQSRNEARNNVRAATFDPSVTPNEYRTFVYRLAAWEQLLEDWK